MKFWRPNKDPPNSWTIERNSITNFKLMNYRSERKLSKLLRELKTTPVRYHWKSILFFLVCLGPSICCILVLISECILKACDWIAMPMRHFFWVSSFLMVLFCLLAFNLAFRTTDVKDTYWTLTTIPLKQGVNKSFKIFSFTRIQEKDLPSFHSCRI